MAWKLVVLGLGNEDTDVNGVNSVGYMGRFHAYLSITRHAYTDVFCLQR